MSIRSALALATAIGVLVAGPASAQKPLTLGDALLRTAQANPRLFMAERDIAIAEARRLQAGTRPNPQLSIEIDNAFGTGDYRWLRSAEATLQLSQVFELGGKLAARVAVAQGEVDAQIHQRAAVRLELLSEATVAFVAVAGAQRRLVVLERQVQSLDRLLPLLQQRVDAGASSPADAARGQVAADLARIDRDRGRTALTSARRDLASYLGLTQPDFTGVAGALDRIARPVAFASIVQAIEANAQLVRWTAIRAQRDAELLAARLKAIPDLQLSVGLRYYRDTGDAGVRVGASIPLPVWDRNRGDIEAARLAAAKTEDERKAARLTLVATAGKAHDTILGSLQELDILRRSVIPNARKALEAVQDGYLQGRFPLLDVLDLHRTLADAELREVDALVVIHTAVATMEGLTGAIVVPAAARTP